MMMTRTTIVMTQMMMIMMMKRTTIVMTQMMMTIKMMTIKMIKVISLFLKRQFRKNVVE